LCCNSKGEVLPAFVIHKGAADGTLAKRLSEDQDGYSDGALVTYQKNAWMDERVMIEWIRQVLAPFVATKEKPGQLIKVLFRL
jgi:DDE superfamily endonuclease